MSRSLASAWRWYAVLLAVVLALMVVAHSHGGPDTPASMAGAVTAATHHGEQELAPAVGQETRDTQTGAVAGWGDALLAGSCLTLGVLVLVRARRGPASAALCRLARRVLRHTRARVPVAPARSAAPVAYRLGVMRV